MTTLENDIQRSSASPRYVLGRHGQAFSTRARAEQIRAEIEQLVADGRDVLIDFEGVRSVSYSFADELIGVFASHYEANHHALRPVVIGLSAQAQRVVLGSLEQRGLPDEVSRELVPH
jgi:hypothetical protein